jgi:hypothetical protein
MTAYIGISTGTIIAENAWRPGVAVNISSVATVSPVSVMNELESVLPLDEGIFGSQLPTTENEAGFLGTKVDSFLDDYYYRIHLIPALIELGTIISAVEETFIIWNSYFNAISCLEITPQGLENITITGLTDPFDLAALEYTTYTVNVPFDGTPEIDASQEFNFDIYGTPIVYITGSRSLIFSFEPQKNITETLEWFTNILTAKNGISTEQRIGLRSAPRQGFKFPIVLPTEKEQARFDAIIFKQQKRRWGLPIWTESIAHRGTINIDDTTISVDTSNTDFRDDSLALIWKSNSQYEAVRISTVAANLLTLSAPILQQFTNTKLIMPVRIAYIKDPISFQDSVIKRSDTAVEFTVIDNILLSGYSAELTYKSCPVIILPSRIVDKTSRSSDADIIWNDPQTDNFELISDSQFNVQGFAHRFENKSRAECWAFRKFIHSLYGRQKTVYIPSFKSDMILSSPMGAADTTFEIESISLALNMALNSLITDLIFIFTDGEKLCREITGITNSGATEIISIDDHLNRIVTVDNCRISFLRRCRLSNDETEIIWDQPNRNSSNLDFTIVKE